MAVAFVALLIGLSGTAVALPGKNKVKKDDIAAGAVSTSDLGNGAVNNRKLRNRSITANKVKLNSLGGGVINETALGKVPSAATADSASSANTAGTANNANALGGSPAAAFERSNETIPFSFTIGEGQRDIARVGPLRLYANCDLDTGGSDEGEIRLDTTVDDALMDDNNGDEFSEFNAADSPAVIFSNSTAADGVEFESTNGGAGVIAAAPGGSALATTNEGIGFNVLGQPDSCYFAGVVVVLGGTAS